MSSGDVMNIRGEYPQHHREEYGRCYTCDQCQVISVVYQAPTDRVSGLLYMGQSLQITFTGEFS